MAYYDIAADDELVEVFDQYDRLPEPGANPALDAFVERKHITIPALVRLGARLSGHTVLAFAFPGGIKFRDIVTDKRWSWAGSEFTRLKILYAGVERAPAAIVAEGETDAARLTLLYPEADIAVLPAGANPGKHAAAYAGQLNVYELVLLGHDYGVKGDEGAAVLQEHLTTKTLRWLAPIEPADNVGWGDLPLDVAAPAIPRPEDVQPPVEHRLIVSTRELLAIQPPDIASYYEQAVLPVGGQMILHGPLKSFKSMIAFDGCAALAQGQPWMGFEHVDEPVRALVMQFEIPWAYYQQRVKMMCAAASDPALLEENLLHWTPLNRPRFVAGNTASEDAVLAELERAGVQVFCLDPIRRATGAVDLNAEKDVRAILHFFERVQDCGIAVITTHHDNKAAVRAGGGDPTDMTGSGAFGGDADTIVSVAIPKGHELTSPERNLHFLLRNAPSPSTRSMHMTPEGIEYGLSPTGMSEEETEAVPSMGSDLPPI